MKGGQTSVSKKVPYFHWRVQSVSRPNRADGAHGLNQSLVLCDLCGLSIGAARGQLPHSTALTRKPPGGPGWRAPYDFRTCLTRVCVRMYRSFTLPLLELVGAAARFCVRN